ncbi:MAG: hypothetical protein KF873_11575 [Gemmataceae bacterium]|nr:hypothetical protein [Planctomycetia bacterium]MBX3399375.1 hypothetical protein [Gemmataceae bacterium]
MNMAVLLEPTAHGFKATSLTVPDLQAEAGSEPEALHAFRQRLTDRIGTHGKIVNLPIDDDEFLKAWKSLSESTDWTEFEQILREQRALSDERDRLEFGNDDGWKG